MEISFVKITKSYIIFSHSCIFHKIVYVIVESNIRSTRFRNLGNDYNIYRVKKMKNIKSRVSKIRQIKSMFIENVYELKYHILYYYVDNIFIRDPSIVT